MTPLTRTAQAKINLSLRVLGRRDDGYHEIESLAVFAGCGDRLELVPGEALACAVEGPFAAALGDDNLVLEAATALGRRRPDLLTGAFRLDKRLPVAAGLGGGSADAAAALHLLLEANPGLAADEAAALCPALGADVAVCLLSRAALMWDRGDRVRALPAIPELPAVLVNPGLAIATAEVYGQLHAPAAPPRRADPPLPGPFADVAEVAAYLRPAGNDLEAAALKIAPAMARVRARLEASSGCLLARMSGSGASYFGLFASDAQAASAATAIAGEEPGWWVTATRLH